MELILAAGVALVTSLVVVLALNYGLPYLRRSPVVERKPLVPLLPEVCEIVEFVYDDGGTRIRHSRCHGDISVEYGRELRGQRLVEIRQLGSHEV